MATATAQGAGTTIRKAAILLVALGEDAGAELLQQLSDKEIKKLSDETRKLSGITSEETETVLKEFYQLGAKKASMETGGADFMRRVLSRALGEASAKKLLQGPSSLEGFEKLQPLVKSDPNLVARQLSDEHPQTIALIVSYLPPEQAAPLMTALPAEIRSEVAVRMARLDQISPEVVAKVAEGIGEKFLKREVLQRESYGGARIVAELCNRFDGEMSREILESMDASNPDLAESVRKLMFVFDDVVKLDDMAMTEINSRVDRKTLVMALKGTSEQVKGHFTKKMSSRAREMLLEDLEALGPVKIKDVEMAQQEVIAIIRALEQEGTISSRSGGGGGGDEYVS